MVRGCAEDLFPGRDCTSARMCGRPIPRRKLYILYCSDYSDAMMYMAGINSDSQEVFSTCEPFGCDRIVML